MFLRHTIALRGQGPGICESWLIMIIADRAKCSLGMTSQSKGNAVIFTTDIYNVCVYVTSLHIVTDGNKETTYLLT